MDADLRSECQTLLKKLQSSQQLLSGHVTSQVKSASSTINSDLQSAAETDPIISYNLNQKQNKKKLKQKFGTDLTSDVNISKDADTNLKPVLARNRLYGLTKSEKLTSSDRSQKISSQENILFEDKQVGKENIRMKYSNEDDKVGSGSEKDTNKSLNPSSWQPATPNTQRRRQLIDRHTSVPTKLNDKDLKALNNVRNLNFNYSYIDANDHVTPLESNQLSDGSASAGESKSSSLSQLNDCNFDKDFESKLTDDGNNRKLSKFVSQTMIKPKSILNSTGYYSLTSRGSKNNSRVQFSSAQKDASLPDHRLLGYDWIAALLDNDSNMVDQSESFFDDIRDFRKAFKDECSNQFYMESPHTLVDTEPAVVAEALAEPKIRPYIVNERLFTEPFTSNLIPAEGDEPQRTDGTEPTKENPRFVRVSIPRSTLQTPYRVKPHRRRSFDAADSCALMDHCLLGWENTRPEMLPAASSLDLNTEAGTRQDSVVTSLAEAERLASAPRHNAWPFAKPQGRMTTLPNWRKHYADTTLNLTQPSLNVSEGEGRGKRKTDKLLQATYSNMYEMERVRQERERERKMEEEVKKAFKN